MRHAHATPTPGELLEMGATAAGPYLVLQHAPEALHGSEVVAASGWHALPPKACMPMGQRRYERVRAVDTPTFDDPYHLVPGGAQRGHHVRDVLPKPCGLKRRDDLREDFGRSLVDSPKDTEQYPPWGAGSRSASVPMRRV
jgi:hypothetical protein